MTSQRHGGNLETHTKGLILKYKEFLCLGDLSLPLFTYWFILSSIYISMLSWMCIFYFEFILLLKLFCLLPTEPLQLAPLSRESPISPRNLVSSYWRIELANKTCAPCCWNLFLLSPLSWVYTNIFLQTYVCVCIHTSINISIHNHQYLHIKLNNSSYWWFQLKPLRLGSLTLASTFWKSVDFPLQR